MKRWIINIIFLTMIVRIQSSKKKERAKVIEQRMERKGGRGRKRGMTRVRGGEEEGPEKVRAAGDDDEGLRGRKRGKVRGEITTKKNMSEGQNVLMLMYPWRSSSPPFVPVLETILMYYYCELLLKV